VVPWEEIARCTRNLSLSLLRLRIEKTTIAITLATTTTADAAAIAAIPTVDKPPDPVASAPFVGFSASGGIPGGSFPSGVSVYGGNVGAVGSKTSGALVKLPNAMLSRTLFGGCDGGIADELTDKTEHWHVNSPLEADISEQPSVLQVRLDVSNLTHDGVTEMFAPWLGMATLLSVTVVFQLVGVISGSSGRTPMQITGTNDGSATVEDEL
jgi:hypothetical protein